MLIIKLQGDHFTNVIHVHHYTQIPLDKSGSHTFRASHWLFLLVSTTYVTYSSCVIDTVQCSLFTRNNSMLLTWQRYIQA